MSLILRSGSLAGWLVLLLLPPAATAQQTANHEAVEQVHRVLARGWISSRHPWYDHQSQEVRPYALPPKQQSAGPSLWERFQNWLGELFGTGWKITLFGYNVVVNFYQVVLVLLGVFFVWLLVRLLRRWYAAYLANRETETYVERSGRGTPERIDQLPVAVPTGSDGLWQLVQQAMQQKRFSQAIVYLYSYLLLQLDRHGRIHLEKGRTNRQYLRQLRNDPQLQQMVGRIVAAFEDVFFGHRELSAQAFQQCWELVPQIQNRVQQEEMARV